MSGKYPGSDRKEFFMKKMKKIIISAAAAAAMLAVVATTAAASIPNGAEPLSSSYDHQIAGNNAVFNYGIGYASMVNLKDFSRLATARVEVYNRITGAYVTYDSNLGQLTYNDSVTAEVDGYSINKYTFRCSGTIHAAGSQYSPIDWDTGEQYVI